MVFVEERKQFNVKRKKHYNEFQAVKLARELMKQDEEEEEEESKRQSTSKTQGKKPPPKNFNNSATEPTVSASSAASEELDQVTAMEVDSSGPQD